MLRLTKMFLPRVPTYDTSSTDDQGSWRCTPTLNMCAMFGLSPAGKKNTANPGGGAIVGVSGTGVNPGRPALTLVNGVNWLGVCRSICWNSG